MPKPRSFVDFCLPQSNFAAAASKTALSRASVMFFRRKASGSRESACASSSMCVSRAKWLAATANHFARETHMDELAHALSLDPLAFRLKNITDARLRAVFEAAAAKFGWGRQKSTKDRGFGIAGGTDKGGYLATCADVEIVEIDGRTRRVRIRRVVAAFECGAVVNPDRKSTRLN